MKTPTAYEPSSALMRTQLLAIFGAVFLALFSAALWAISLSHVDIRRVNNFGLVSVLPLSFFLAFMLLMTGVCLTLRQQRPSVPTLGLFIAGLIFMLYGTPTLIEEVPRVTHSWMKAGVAEYIMRTGYLDRKIDHNFNWPGFYILSALLTEITGLRSPISVAAWAPLFFNLLYLGPLVMIFRSATSDNRLVWLAILFFYLSNWIGQDYFSPQGIGYFYYLVILGVILQRFKVTAAPGQAAGTRRLNVGLLAPFATILSGLVKPMEPPGTSSRPWQYAGLIGIIVVLFGVVTSTHQLTPLFVLAGVSALVVFNQCTARGLPVLMAVIIGTWISYATVPWMASHIGELTSNVGQVSNNINENVAQRLRGSPEHRFVVHTRVVLTLAIWCLALLGALRRLRKGYRDLAHALLAVVPFPFVVLQPYGGEMLNRSYFFALPFMVFFAATLFYTTPTNGTSWWTTGAVTLVSVALFGLFLFARYGNEHMDYVTFQDVEAVRFVYSIAEPGSLLVSVSWNVPWRSEYYERYRHRELGFSNLLNPDADRIMRYMESSQYPSAYLIITRGQKAHADLFAGLPASAWERFEQALMESRKFQVVFANNDAKVFALAGEIDKVQP